MASPAQTIRHKLLNTFFSRHSVWFLCILIALGITMLRLFYEPHYIYYFVSDTLLNSVWLITALLSLLGLYDILQNRHSILKTIRLWDTFAISLKIFAQRSGSILLNRIMMHCHFHGYSAVWYISVRKMKIQINPLAQF